MPTDKRRKRGVYMSVLEVGHILHAHTEDLERLARWLGCALPDREVENSDRAYHYRLACVVSRSLKRGK